MTTAENRRIASRWIPILQKANGKPVHKFTLMEIVDMSNRQFVDFKKWFMWKFEHNVKFEDDCFRYISDEVVKN